MQASKILFSAEELRLAQNSDWILTKNRIIMKIISLFGSLSEAYQESVKMKQQALPDAVLTVSPKISRGEQYQGLPYVMLDYPRIFSRENVFAIRTFYWWGNYFSLTLHLKGQYKNAYQEKIEENIHMLSNNKFCIAVSEDEWRHDFKEENYVPLRSGEMVLQENLKQRNFLKLAARWSLENSNEIEPLLLEQYAVLLKMLAG